MRPVKLTGRMVVLDSERYFLLIGFYSKLCARYPYDSASH